MLDLRVGRWADRGVEDHAGTQRTSISIKGWRRCLTDIIHPLSPRRTGFWPNTSSLGTAGIRYRHLPVVERARQIQGEEEEVGAAEGDEVEAGAAEGEGEATASRDQAILNADGISRRDEGIGSVQGVMTRR